MTKGQNGKREAKKPKQDSAIPKPAQPQAPLSPLTNALLGRLQKK